jgi:hypothetical protein
MLGIKNTIIETKVAFYRGPLINYKILWACVNVNFQRSKPNEKKILTKANSDGTKGINMYNGNTRRIRKK